MNTIDSILTSPEMKEAEKSFHRVFDNIPEKKAEIIRAMTLCWRTAWNAYNAAMGYHGEDTDEKKIMGCGSHADIFFIQFRSVQFLLGNESVDSVLKKMNATSRWLEERGWTHLPTPVDQDGVRHEKTADGMYEDMKRFSDTKMQLIQRIRAEKEGSRR